MATIKLKAPSGGSVSLVAGDTASDVVFTIPPTTSTIVTSDVLAAPTGSSLVGYMPAGVGAVGTDVQSKLRGSIKNVFDFMSPAEVIAVQTATYGGAVPDVSAAVQKAIDSLQAYETLESIGGTIRLSVALDLRNVPNHVTINLNSRLYVPTALNAVHISGVYLNVFIAELYGENVAGSTAIEVVSTMTSNITVDRIYRFDTGWEVNGTYGYAGSRNGTIYCNFNSMYVSVIGTACKLTASPKIGYTVNGYTNENVFTLRWLTGTTGVQTVKPSGDVSISQFDSNSFITIGLENISGVGFDLNYAKFTAIVRPRIENIGGFVFQESADCSRNVYYLHRTILPSDLNLLGLLSQIYGEMIDSNGKTKSYYTQQTATGALLHFSTEVNTVVDAEPNTISYKDHFGKTFGDRIEVYDSVKTRKFIRIQSEQAINDSTITAATFSVPKEYDVLNVSSASNAVAITMSAEKETNGTTMLLNLPNATNPVTIKKSTGYSVTPITTAGLYQLVFMNEAWRWSLIGSALTL